MIENFNYEKAEQFLRKTNQTPTPVLKGVNSRRPINYKTILDALTKKDNEGIMSFISYYDEEQLYCKIIKDMDYNVPFTFIEFRCAIMLVNLMQNSNRKKVAIHKLKKHNAYNQTAIDFAQKLKENLY